MKHNLLIHVVYNHYSSRTTFLRLVSDDNCDKNVKIVILFVNTDCTLPQNNVLFIRVNVNFLSEE